VKVETCAQIFTTVERHIAPFKPYSKFTLGTS